MAQYNELKEKKMLLFVKYDISLLALSINFNLTGHRSSLPFYTVVDKMENLNIKNKKILDPPLVVTEKNYGSSFLTGLYYLSATR